MNTGAAPENVKKAGTLIGRRSYLNLIEGANTTLTVADNSGTDSIDVTVASSGGGGGSIATDTIWDALGDTVYGSGADTGAKLAGNTTTTRKFLRQVGDGAASAAPAWDQPTGSDLSLSDVTTNDVSTSRHGFAPKAPNDATKSLDGTGAYSVGVTAGNGITLSGKTVTAIVSTAQTADVTTSETTTSATYADLATTGPTITATIGASGLALCLIRVHCTAGTSLDSVYASLSVDSATPADVDAAVNGSTAKESAESVVLVTGLSAASHTFKIQYRRDTAGTATFLNRRLVVIPL